MSCLLRHAFVFAVVFGALEITSATGDADAASAAADDARATGSVDGSVMTSDGAAVRNAFVSLQGAGATESRRTDGAGHFTLAHLAPGTYAIRVSALGFDPLAPRAIGVSPAQTTEITLALARSSSSLATIGRVQANGGDALSTSSAPVSTIDTQTFAAEGYTRVSDALQDDMSTTLVHPIAGSNVLPTSVALRGPDPTETLVDIDGHRVNTGNTGDFDLSMLDPADYGSIELVKGISPSSLVGPDTIDGAINIRTLEPTLNPHGLLRFSGGSFNSFAETLAATGTQGRLGYAFSLHRTTTDGDVNGPIFDLNSGAQAQVGSGVLDSTALGKLRYAFGNGGDGYAEVSFHDQSIGRDISAGLSSYPSPAATAPAGLVALDGFEGTGIAAHNAGYGLDVRAPLGPASLLFRHYTSLVSQSVFGPGADTSPYLYNDRDLVGENSLEFDKQFSNGSLTLQYTLRTESLAIAGLGSGGDVNAESIARGGVQASSIARRTLDDQSAAAPAASNTALEQTQRAAVLRYVYDPTAKLHLTAAGYYSDYSIFGHSLDPRFGFVYTPDSRSAVRFSLGTTYQAPQLPELYVPAALPPPVGGIVSIGNPNLRPDRATEYGLGASRVLETGPHRTELSVDVYRVNLRTLAAPYQPATPDSDCGPAAVGGDGTACPLSFPVNAGDGVYQGIELSGQRRFTRYVTLRAGYAVRSAFLTNIPAYIQDGSLVVNQQSLGLPLQKGTLAVQATPPRGFTFRAGLVYEGRYNELNAPPFVTLSAAVGYRWPSFELIVSGTNLTDVYDQRFTRTGAGVPYAGFGQTVITDAYALQGTAFNISLARRF